MHKFYVIESTAIFIIEMAVNNMYFIFEPSHKGSFCHRDLVRAYSMLLRRSQQ